jgi:serine/threonine protein kinase
LGKFWYCEQSNEPKRQKFYAIKKIPIKRNEIKRVRRELEIMEKLKSHYIVEYKSSWIEKNYIEFRSFENSSNTNQDIK